MQISMNVRILCLYIYIDVLFTADLINALLNASKMEASKSALNRQ